MREGHGFVDARQRAVRAERLRLELREQPGIEPSIADAAVIRQDRQRPSKLFRSGRGVIETTARPPHIQFGHDGAKDGIPCSRPRRSRASAALNAAAASPRRISR